MAIDGPQIDRPAGADLRHTTEISCSMRTLCPAEDYGDNLSEDEPFERSDVHHAAKFGGAGGRCRTRWKGRLS